MKIIKKDLQEDHLTCKVSIYIHKCRQRDIQKYSLSLGLNYWSNSTYIDSLCDKKVLTIRCVIEHILILLIITS